MLLVPHFEALVCPLLPERATQTPRLLYSSNTIITCDNGIAAVTAIDLAKSLGMTVVVTDHHEVPFEETDAQTISMRLNTYKGIKKSTMHFVDDYSFEKIIN